MTTDTTWRADALNELAHATADVAAAVEALRLAHRNIERAKRDLSVARKRADNVKRAIGHDTH